MNSNSSSKDVFPNYCIPKFLQNPLCMLKNLVNHLDHDNIIRTWWDSQKFWDTSQNCPSVKDWPMIHSKDLRFEFIHINFIQVIISKFRASISTSSSLVVKARLVLPTWDLELSKKKWDFWKLFFIFFFFF